MCLSIAIVMLISEKIEEKFDISSIFADAFIRVLICYIVVLFEGCLFKMFAFSWMSFLYISPILIPTYIITYALSYFNHVKYANAINNCIQQKK
jgi:sterol desaturase/sphingolipid hydroxylase (fatty acid hydroxylase superfamily)